MTHKARLLARVHGLDPDGRVWAQEGGLHFPVYDVSQVPPEYKNLLAAAPLMLRAIDTGLPMLDTIARVFEEHNLDAHCVPLMQLEAGLNVAMNAALFGYEAYKKR